MIIEKIKFLLPKIVFDIYRGIWNKYNLLKTIKAIHPDARKLYRLSKVANNSNLILNEGNKNVREKVEHYANMICMDKTNFYSDALRKEVVYSFEKAIDAVSNINNKIDYLEIGSCHGISMSIIGLMLKNRGILGKLTSIDPYYKVGYFEGQYGPFHNNYHISINKDTKEIAFRMYDSLGLSVELYEMTSLEGLIALIEKKRRFNLIYIDGSHEKLCPTIDFSLSFSLLRREGVIILDDHLWPDVVPIKTLCDKYAKKVHETWKTVSYKLDGST